MSKVDKKLPNYSACYNQIRGLIPTWEQADLCFGAKDIHSRFVYANPAYKRLLNLPERFDPEGRYDHEMPAPTSEFAEEFRFHDRLVEKTGARKASLEINEFGKNRNLSAYFFDKIPLCDDNDNVIGTLFMGRRAIHLDTDFYLNVGRPDSVILTKPSEIFTDSQWEIIFLLMRGLTNKQIAQKLQRSVDTIKTHLKKVMKIAKVNSREQLLEFIDANGWSSYIPEKYMNSRRHILLQ